MAVGQTTAPDGFRFVSPSNTSAYQDMVAGLASAAWPEFMLHDPVADEFWEHLFSDFPDCQFALVDNDSGRVAAMANSLPLNWDGFPEELPEGGWDWAFRQGVHDRLQGLQPHTLCAIQIAIHPDYRGEGLSAGMVNEMRAVSRRQGFERLIAPVRPNQKSQYPLIEIDNYIRWKTKGGLPFDAWLRVHARAGARLIKPCHNAMEIHGTRSEWQEWTGLEFPGSGCYIIPGGLVPMKMDVESDDGSYIEPNVWVVHDLSI